MLAGPGPVNKPMGKSTEGQVEPNYGYPTNVPSCICIKTVGPLFKDKLGLSLKIFRQHFPRRGLFFGRVGRVCTSAPGLLIRTSSALVAELLRQVFDVIFVLKQGWLVKFVFLIVFVLLLGHYTHWIHYFYCRFLSRSPAHRFYEIILEKKGVRLRIKRVFYQHFFDQTHLFIIFRSFIWGSILNTAAKW